MLARNTLICQVAKWVKFVKVAKVIEKSSSATMMVLFKNTEHNLTMVMFNR